MDQLFASKIKNYLDRLAVSMRKPKSYLFYGPPGVGKEEAAIYFVSKIAGKERNVDFLHRVKAGTHPDVLFIGPEMEEKNSKVREKEIVIGQVRKAQEQLRYFPYEIRQKFCIVKKAERLNQEAANALLKVLEEPTPSMFFILLASDSEAVLPTILSRCAVLRFALADEKEILNWLGRKGIIGEEAKKILTWSTGRMRLVKQFTEQKESLLKKEERRETFKKLFLNEIFEKFDFSESLAKDRVLAVEVLEDWEIAMNRSLEGAIAFSGGANKNENAPYIANLIKIVRKAANQIKYTNANPKYILDCLSLDLTWRKH